jgi:hypothetical protein
MVTITELNNSFTVEAKLKTALQKHHISIYRLSKLSGIRYELLRRSFNSQRKLSASEFIKILSCTGIQYEEVI